MSTFLLVHGGWHGGWCWDRVVSRLTAAGHRALAPDLPGHGADRTPIEARPWEQYLPTLAAHLAAASEPAILVGHSSGGMLISALAEREPARVAALVYLAAFLLPPGVTPPEVMQDATESRLNTALVVDRERGVLTVRPDQLKAVFYHDCTDADTAWAISRLVPEPLVPRGAEAAEAPPATPATAPRFYIETLQDRALPPAVQRRLYTALPCQRVYSLATSHSPFLSAPAQLAAHLLDIAALVASPPPA